MSLYNITHKDDIDGMLSHGILKTKFPNIIPIPAGYDTIDDDIPLDKFKKNDTIIITDFCLDVKDMEYLSKLCKVIWIDHHISSINKIKESNIKFYMNLSSTNMSACGLTWKFCYPNIPLPTGVLYATKYDNWDHNGNKKIINFNFGLYSLDNITVNNYKLWNQVIESNQDWINMVIQRGDAIVNYLKYRLGNIFDSDGFECKYEDYNCYTINTFMGNTLFFEQYMNKYDIVFTFQYNGKQDIFRIGIYSDKIDVSEIAKKYNGGGHQGAAGFQVNSLEEFFKIVKKV